MMLQRHSDTETGYAVHCPVHGLVHLLPSEYMAQMMSPNDFWRCPKPNANNPAFGCELHSHWDDDTYDRVFYAGDDDHEGDRQ